MKSKRRIPWLLVGAVTLVWAAASRSPSEAAAILDALLRGTAEEPAETPAKTRGGPADGTPLFVSDVRLVNLSVSVTDGGGHPVPGLKPSQFRILENGVPQQVSVAGAEEVPFNLVLLLDLSGSTIRDRAAMRETARRFIGIARPQDRVAVYALASDRFGVISSLTTDRQRLLELVDGIPDLKGATPLYASVVLAWNEEIARLPRERNALIVISDGIDDSLEQKPVPVSFDRLRQAVPAMASLIYPVYLDSRHILYGERARRQMRQLAEASGGRLFSARSLRDLEPVYAEVAEELRSVYTLAYSPKNQAFDGRWRRIQVHVNRPRLTVRTRAGYYAR